MKKLFLSIIALSFLWVSCDSPAPEQNNEAETTAVTDLTPKMLDINKFDETADGLANQLVEIRGTVMHTCKHGGTKMFIAGEDTDSRVKVVATDESGNFNLEMEGNEVVVIGTLDEYRVDNAELDRLEADVLSESKAEGEEDMKHKEGEHEGDHADHGEDEHAEESGSCSAEDQARLDQINELRQEVKDSEKGFISFYSIKAKSYKELEK